MDTCSVHGHGKDPKDLILAHPSFNNQQSALKLLTFWRRKLFWSNPNCLCLRCQMFRKCSSSHNQHQTWHQIFTYFQNWGFSALYAILNPHISVLVLPWKNFPDNGQRLFLGHLAGGEIHLELLHQNLYVLLSELVALGCFIQANIKQLTWNTKRMVRIRWLKTKTFYEDKIETNLRQMKLKQTRINLKQSKLRRKKLKETNLLAAISFFAASSFSRRFWAARRARSFGSSKSSLIRIVSIKSLNI